MSDVLLKIHKIFKNEDFTPAEKYGIIETFKFEINYNVCKLADKLMKNIK